MSILKEIIRGKELFKIVLLSGVMFCSIQTTRAQVTIGSDQAPNPDALLDLKQTGATEKGILMPRVALQKTDLPNPLSAHEEGMVVYNTATVADLTPGFYYNNGAKWMKFGASEGTFFYLPPTILPIDKSDPAFNSTTQKFSINLHDAYKDQFTTPSCISHPSAGLPVYESNELHYFVTYADPDVFDDVQVSDAGVLTYGLKSSYVYSEKTFMNIVCQVK